MFLVVSALGGVLAAGLIVPTAGVGAEAAKAVAEGVQSLPAELETPPQAEGSKVLMADGSVLTNFYDENRIYVTLDNIAPVMRQAQVAIEDNRFYQHGALDLKGTLRALVRTSAGNTQGGSTLTQQYVKLVLLDKAISSNDPEQIRAAQARTVARKVLELRYAIALEQRLTKDEILERYLNQAYFGEGAYGVEAAARRYFGSTAKKLTLDQAAMLAGLVRNPVTTNPIKAPKVAIERRNNVLTEMRKLGVITAAQEQQARKAGWDPAKVTKTVLGCANSKYPHLCNLVENTLKSLPAMGPDRETRTNRLYRGGLTIQTELDPTFQDAAQAAVSGFIVPTDPVIGVIVMIEPGTGLIKGMAQSRPKMGAAPGTFYNYAVERKNANGDPMGGTLGFSGGSTFKAFTLAAALEKGIPTSRTYNVERVRNWQGERFKSCQGTFRQRARYQVTGSAGVMDMYEGAKRSSNNYFIELEQDTGICEVTTMAAKLGLKSGLGYDLPAKYSGNPSFTLGTAEITPVSLATAYATFAARGKRCDPIIIKSAVDREGKAIPVPNGNCQQVIPEWIADTVNDVLQGPFNPGGTAAPANIPGYQIAGKTGTDDNAPTIWTMGYTPKLVGAAMITVDRAAPRFKGDRTPSLEGVRIAKGRLAGRSGAEAGGRIWKPAMRVALAKLGSSGRFVRPDAGQQPAAEWVTVPSCRGMSVSECRSTLRGAEFSTSVSEIASSRPEGTLLGLSPSRRAKKYSTIRVLVSAGPTKAPKPRTTITAVPVTPTTAPSQPAKPTKPAKPAKPTKAPTTKKGG